MNEQMPPAVAGPVETTVRPDPDRDARWAMAAEVARGRMAGGWVPVDADLVLALHARLEDLRDCRTCRHFRGTQHCHSVLRCVDGGSYQRGGVVQLWETATVDAGF